MWAGHSFAKKHNSLFPFLFILNKYVSLCSSFKISAVCWFLISFPFLISDTFYKLNSHQRFISKSFLLSLILIKFTYLYSFTCSICTLFNIIKRFNSYIFLSLHTFVVYWYSFCIWYLFPNILHLFIHDNFEIQL